MIRASFHRRPAALCAFVLAVLAAGCEKNTQPPSGPGPGDDGGQVTARKLAVPATHPLYDRFEGIGFPNDCSADSQCLKGGCSSEVCSADQGVVTTCEALPISLPASTACGCVEGQCQWWNPDGLVLPDLPAPSEEPAEVSCATTLCQPPTKCLEYYGIAGPSGPKFVSCEIACDPTSKKKDACPSGMSCVTIADGPGNVCR